VIYVRINNNPVRVFHPDPTPVTIRSGLKKDTALKQVPTLGLLV
jgi:hypothetical protein